MEQRRQEIKFELEREIMSRDFNKEIYTRNKQNRSIDNIEEKQNI